MNHVEPDEEQMLEQVQRPRFALLQVDQICDLRQREKRNTQRQNDISEITLRMSQRA
jgi:hypothetical protein